MKIKELFSDPKAWTRGVYARNKDGLSIDPFADGACKFCLVGAILKCYPDRDERVAIHDKLGEATKNFGGVINFNDTRNHEDVLKLVTELDV